MDAVPFIIELHPAGQPGRPKDFGFLTELRQHVQWQRGDAVLLAEANVEPEQLQAVLRRRWRLGQPAAHAVRLHAQRPRWCSRWPGRTRSRSSTRCGTPRSCPPARSGRRSCATTTRSTSPGSPATSARTSSPQFGPDEEHAAVRPRHPAPARPDARQRPAAASSWRTRCSSRLRGTPVLRYGEEIGMGEDLSLAGRNAIRTPMQWSTGAQRRLLDRHAEAAGPAGRSPAASSATRGSTSGRSGTTRARCWAGSSG